MQPILSREQIRDVDRRAIASGVPGLVLMENAGRGATEVALRLLSESARAESLRRVVVACGAGNNGGDGFVVARLLRTRGVEAEVFSFAPRSVLRGDALDNAKAFEAIGGTIHDGTKSGGVGEFARAAARANLTVDALLGTGATRQVEGLFAEVIDALNAVPCPILALDVPSGLDAETGAVLGRAVRASHTVTFAFPKLGLYSTSGHEHSGEIVVRDIGIPPAGVEPTAHLLERSDLAALVRPRSLVAHKGSSGRVLAVAGSLGKLGAARLVARAALRTGAGLVTVALRDRAAEVFDQGTLEEMTTRLDPADPGAELARWRDRANALAVGPGLGLDDEASRTVEAALSLPLPAVVDADALRLVAGRPELLGSGPRLLTPHPGEAAALLETTIPEVEADRFGAVRRLAERTGASVVLKGSRTLVAAPGKAPVVNSFGTPALATGGSGDVLTGILATLLCHLEPFEAALVGVGVHGLCAERWTGPAGRDRGLLAHEIADLLPDVLAELSQEPTAS